MNLQYYFKGNINDLKGKKSVDPPGIGDLFFFKKGFTNEIKLEYKSPSNEKGTIWLHPTTNEIKVNLNEKYYWKYDVEYGRIEPFRINNFYQFVYSIDNSF